MTICSSADLLSFFLKMKSPSARDRAKLPFTRLNSTQPPAATIRFASLSFAGLWSKLSGSATPDTQATARESPTLPYKRKRSLQTTLRGLNARNRFDCS